MSLTRRQFEIGVEAETEQWMHRIYAYLSENRHLAFSAAELFEQLSSDELNDRTRSEWALEALEDVWAIESGLVAGEKYYAYYLDMDTSAWKPKRDTSEVRQDG